MNFWLKWGLIVLLSYSAIYNVWRVGHKEEETPSPTVYTIAALLLFGLVMWLFAQPVA